MFEIHSFAFKDWIYSLTIGILVVSYWRGSWVLLDIWGCDQPADATLTDGTSFCFLALSGEEPYASLRRRSARFSYGIGLVLLFVGVTVMWVGLWVPKNKQVTPVLAVVRFFIVYCLGTSAVCLWRGIWYWADAWVLPSNPLASYWTTSIVGSTVAFCIWGGNSLLAPPAIYLLDGPGFAPPPLAVTLIASHYSLTTPVEQPLPIPPIYVQALDVLVSFFFLPFAVVWFWRGSWMILDWYLWGINESTRDLILSLAWSTVFFFFCIWVTCEAFTAFIDRRFDHPILLAIFGRFRTWILAWGTVGFWRVVWYVWDIFLGGTSVLSAALAHALPVVCLIMMGCVSSINAPASTCGVDSVPDPKCADEPLFSVVPLPWELLHFCAIGRQPVPPSSTDTVEKDEIIEMTQVPEDTEIEKEPPLEVQAEEVPRKRPGLGKKAKAYYGLQRPLVEDKVCTSYAQRPGMDNQRARSKYFRNR